MRFSFILIIMSILFACTDKSAQKAGYEGKDISGIAEIIRDKNTKEATLHIQSDGKWKLYSGPSVERIDFFAPLLEGEKSGSYKLDIPSNLRMYFQIVTGEGKAILAERHLPMEGGYNFRDLGGYPTQEGRYVKWGKIFRSDDLHNLTEADLKYLATIPLTTIVDFRSEQEINAAPDKNPASVKHNYSYSITPGNLSTAMDFSQLDPGKMDSIMEEINILLVTDSIAIDAYKKMFDLLQNENDIPLMFHCSAGKDRTGMAAALIFYALGVNEDIIMQDYLSSNTYLGDKYAEYINKYPQLKSLFEVKSQFLQAGINRIKQDHGSVENYLVNTLEVDINKFKDMYLY